jgi:hypothetical protein
MDMIENTAVAVAIVAALVSMLSALYARWQVDAARVAIDISRHDYRLATYKGLGRFRSNIISHGASFSEEELWRFGDVVQLSEFYFPLEIYKDMDALFNDAMLLKSKHDDWSRLRDAGSEEARVLAKPKQELMRTLRDKCFKVAEDMKVHLKVGNA